MENVFEKLYKIILARQAEKSPDSYSAKLLSGGNDRIGKKVIEEAGEVVIAAKNNVKDELVWEIADLVYHLLLLMVFNKIKIADIAKELKKRFK
jgi:phosphoribosyl-ATP pyrophosphohydrolase